MCFGKEGALGGAVTAYREALWGRTRERVPLKWAATQNNLCIALQTLGERERGAARLEEAVTAFREALKDSGLDPKPLVLAGQSTTTIDQQTIALTAPRDLPDAGSYGQLIQRAIEQRFQPLV